MKLLVIGKTGQLARELARLAPGARFAGRDEAPLDDPAACARLVRASGARAVINAAAFTDVDGAQSAAAEATRANAEAPGAMAAAARETGAAFVQISSDYVFGGAGTAPWAPDAAPAPLNRYGESKLAGEIAVRESGAAHAILRSSWVFSAHGRNFVNTMLRLSDTHETLRIVADQIGGPTPADALAAAARAIAEKLVEHPDLSGTYHFAGAPDVSWAGFAREIMAQAGRSTRIVDISSAAYPTPARRPLNSRLDCRRTEARFGLARPDWQSGLSRVLTELGAHA